MKIIKKLDANNNIVFVNAETNELVEMELEDQVTNNVKAQYDQTIAKFMEQQKEANAKIESLIATNKAQQEANVKNEFIKAGGNEMAWNVLKASHPQLLESQDLKTDLANIRKEHGFLFTSSPNHETKEVDTPDPIDPDSFY